MAPAMYTEPDRPTSVALRPSVSGSWSTLPSAPTIVTSRPSKIHVMPSAVTKRECHETHARLSRRCGMSESKLAAMASGRSNHECSGRRSGRIASELERDEHDEGGEHDDGDRDGDRGTSVARLEHR